MENWHLTPAQNIGQPMRQQLKSARRENGLPGAMMHLIWYGVVGVGLKLFHRLTIEGRHHLPASGPFILASNHASHLDALVLASAIPWNLQSRVFPVAAGDTFFSTPLAGAFSALVINALPMWRNRACPHGIADLRDRLIREQCIYIVFPEGTRTRTGDMSPFRAGLGMLLAATDVPVIPCYLSGTFEAMPHNRRLPKPSKVRLKIGERILFKNVINNRRGWESITTYIESAVIAVRDRTDARLALDLNPS